MKKKEIKCTAGEEIKIENYNNYWNKMDKNAIEQSRYVAPNKDGFFAKPSNDGLFSTHDDYSYDPTSQLTTKVDKENQMVSHPSHYNKGGMETIDKMLILYGKEKVKAFCELNAFKYRDRAGYKDNIIQDIQKAMWYEAKLKELDENTDY